MQFVADEKILSNNTFIWFDKRKRKNSNAVIHKIF
jgi:hypothetical protein